MPSHVAINLARLGPALVNSLGTRGESRQKHHRDEIASAHVILQSVRIVGSNIFSAGKPRAVEISMFLRVTATHMLTRTEAVEINLKFIFWGFFPTLALCPGRNRRERARSQ